MLKNAFCQLRVQNNNANNATKNERLWESSVIYFEFFLEMFKNDSWQEHSTSVCHFLPG